MLDRNTPESSALFSLTKTKNGDDFTDVPKAKYNSQLLRRKLSRAVKRAADAQHKFAVALTSNPQNCSGGHLADLVKNRAHLLREMFDEFDKLESGVVTLLDLETVAMKLFITAESAYREQLIAARQPPIAARQLPIAARQQPIAQQPLIAARQRLIAARQLLSAVLLFTEATSQPHFAGEGSAVRSWAFALNSFCIFGEEMQETDTVRGVSSTAPAADAACFAHRT